ncbi:MAG: PEP-CTERM sorting domain-containing protein [Pseudomonadota bacterium]
MRTSAIKSLLPLGLLACTATSAQAAADLDWQIRYTNASVGANGGLALQVFADQYDPGVDPGNLNAQAADEDLFALAFAHLDTQVTPLANGGLQIDINGFGDLFSQVKPPHAWSSAYVNVIFQLAIETDQAYGYDLATALYPASGLPGLSQYDHYVAFDDDGDGWLDPGQTALLYGTISYRLDESLGVQQSAYPGTQVSLTLAPVPEPETWAMLLVGLGLTALRLRGRGT